MQTSSARQLILVTGPARSGKSEWAESLAMGTGQPVIYVATASGNDQDPEWQERVRSHRQRRPSNWSTLEVPVTLSATIEQANSETCLLIDSIGTWLANILDQNQHQWHLTTQQLLHSLQQCPATVILVAEETGWGVVPAYPSGRLFRDRLGSLVRQIGGIADAVYLITAGYALNLKVLGIPLSML